MKKEIKISEEVINFISAYGHKIINFPNEEVIFYHFPFWIKEVDGRYILYSFDELPKDLLNHISKDRKATHFYKDKPYMITGQTKMKVNDIWMDAIIYEPLYDDPNLTSKTFVRAKSEFEKLFKPI